MKHLTEEELIEHYFAKKRNEDSSEDREHHSAAPHIAECVECGASYAALEADLDELTDVKALRCYPGYGERVWQSIEHQLPEMPERKPVWSYVASWRIWAYAAAAAMLLAITFHAGRMWEHAKTPVVSTKSPASTPEPKRVMVVVLSDHLERTERLLVELKHTGADESDMLSPLREEARDLLPANRICQREAEKSDDPELEEALKSLDSLLTELADKPGGLDPAVVAHLQKQMSADGLLFEVRVLRARMPAKEHASGTPSEGGKI